MKAEWTLERLGVLLNGNLFGEKTLLIDNLSIDSRTLTLPRGTLFVALTGEQHDGHNYIPDLYRRGIRAFLVSRIPDGSQFPGAGFCQVQNTLIALQELASARRREFEGEVLAITGSNGKTIVKEWIYQCLGDSIRIHKSPKSYNSQVGVPLSVWGIEEVHQLAVIEAGISQPGEMQKLHRVILPDAGIFTHFGTAHQEHFSSEEAKLREKLFLFNGCKKVICRADSKVGSRSIYSHLEGLQSEIVDWSLQGPAKYRYRITGRTSSGTSMALNLPGNAVRFNLPFYDDASLENALHVFTYCLEQGFSPEFVKKQAEKLEPVSMRLEILKGIMGSTLINDSYNSDTGGVLAALDLMGQQDSHMGRVVILSDLLQSGKKDRELYSEIATLLKTKEIDQFIGIGPALSENRLLFPLSSLFYQDTESFLKRMDRTLFQEKTILIKGSRHFGFERITRELQLKTHQTRLETDLNAMVHNLNYFRSLLNEQVLTMAMVKALSYGSGNIEVAKLLQYHQVDYLAVAFIDEGVELRKAGIHLPIMVLNPQPSGFGSMLDYLLEPEIFNFRGVDALQHILHQRGITDYPVHVKLDTGMHRLGFEEDDLELLIPRLQDPGFQVVSVFSHLAASGLPIHDAFTRRQIRHFDHMCTEMENALDSGFKKHILNSAGIERFPGAQYDMVRLGIGLHGIGNYSSLKVVSSFKTSISQVRTIAAGESVGYERSGMTRVPSSIATIPVGYADGFQRSLGNGAGKVFVNGKAAPTIGEICMDMTMIDVTGLEVMEGDVVELFGRQQPVSELARQAGTIPYEILTSVSERVKRVYLQE
jgi:alanine racemase